MFSPNSKCYGQYLKVFGQYFKGFGQDLKKYFAQNPKGLAKVLKFLSTSQSF